MARLELRVMGPFEASLAGKPITSFESNKVKALLAYLAIEAAHTHRRPALMALFWPAYPREKALANLRNALSHLHRLLGDASASQPFLHITRENIQFNRESDVWVDLWDFDACLVKAANSAHRYSLGWQKSFIRNLQSAISLYRGALLEDLCLPDSSEYDEWCLLQQDKFNSQVLRSLQQLTEALTALGDYDLALQYARQQLNLEPWLEEAHQQVMHLLALSGQSGAAVAQFESCRRWLKDALGVDPAHATVHLYHQILDKSFIPPFRLPDFLSLGSAVSKCQPFFVARHAEMTSLERALQQALNGNGQMRFILGSPGSGKTALVEAFMRRSWDAHSDIIAVRGTCQAYYGGGDPYQPFREVLELLTGEVENRWKAGAINREQATRLWLIAPESIKILTLVSPALIDTFLPGERLLARAKQTILSEPDWISRLETIVKSRRGALQSVDLLNQYHNLLIELSRQWPLVIFIDDLQWSDPDSRTLLFHLGRRLAGSRILFVVALRPDEGHPSPGSYSTEEHNRNHSRLAGLINEFKLLFDETVIDLDRIEEPDFINALLDSEPNLLGETFRRELFNQTHGHPLFTIELLRQLQAKGDLIKNQDGRWVATAGVAWDELPPRVEAVISESFRRLPGELYNLLQAASVEGEHFTLEVLAEIQTLDEEKILYYLSDELERRYHLVKAEGVIQLDQRRITRFGFRHILFQRYLYQKMDSVERMRLHGQVGTQLEKLYNGRVTEISAQLAHHFEQAGNLYCASEYLYQAGCRASNMSANSLALDHFNHALDLIPANDQARRFKLLSGRERVYHNTGQRQAQEKDLQTLEVLAQGLGTTCQALAALRRAHYCDKTWKFDEVLQSAERAINLGRINNMDEVVIEAIFLQSLAHHVIDLHRAAELGEQALGMARQKGLPALEADILCELGICYEGLDLEKARFYARQAIDLYQVFGNRAGEARALLVEGVYLADRHNYTGSLRAYERSHQLCQDSGDRQDELYALSQIVMLYQYLGRPDLMISDLLEAVEWTRHLEVPYFQFFVLFRLSMAYFLMNDLAQGLTYIGKAFELHHKGGISADPQSVPLWGGYCHVLRGVLRAGLGQVIEADEDFIQAIDLFQQTPDAGYQQLPWIFQAQLAYAQGDLIKALACIEKGLPLLETQTCYYPDPTYFLEYLIVFKVLAANQDRRAAEVLRKAYHRLQEQAECISDECLRRSFLENYPWQRDITVSGR